MFCQMGQFLQGLWTKNLGIISIEDEIWACAMIILPFVSMFKVKRTDPSTEISQTNKI